MRSQEKLLSFGLEIPSGIISSLPGMNTALKSLNSEIHKQAKEKKEILTEISNLSKNPSRKAGWHFLRCTWIFLH